MTRTQNLAFNGADHPDLETLFPPELNPNKNKKLLFINASVDSATNLMIGNTCYLSAGTQANDMTAISATYGTTSLQGFLFIVQPDGNSPYFPYSTTFLSNIIPNSSVTASDYQYPAEASIKLALLEKGDYFWGLVATNAGGSATFGYQYIAGANGLWVSPGDPDGIVIDEVAHTATACATFTSTNWVLFRFEGREAHDKTA